MAQIFRAYKSKVPILIRICNSNYKEQRCTSSYYEVLRVSPNSTQKEIRDAYIKLSKEMHPDSGKKGNHVDFVKINEAYNALYKKKDKSRNIEFKYSGAYTTNSHKYYRYDSASRQWEECTMRYARNKMKYSKEDQRKKLRHCIWIIVIASFIKALYIATFLIGDTRSRLKMSQQIQYEYLALLEECQNKTMQEQLKKIKDSSTKYNMSPTDR